MVVKAFAWYKVHWVIGLILLVTIVNTDVLIRFKFKYYGFDPYRLTGINPIIKREIQDVMKI